MGQAQLQEKYPKELLEIPEIKEAYEALKLVHSAYAFLENELALHIKKAQDVCPHPEWLETWSYTNHQEKNSLDQKTCLGCGKIELRPTGGPCTICKICWGKMKFEDRSGGNPDDKIFHYKCTNCSHEEWHT